MAGNDIRRGKCFTFIWQLENSRYCWQNKGEEGIASPGFVVEEIEKLIWKLEMIPRYGESGSQVALYLSQSANNNVEIHYEIAFLDQNGNILESKRYTRRTFDKESDIEFLCCAKREDVFPTVRSSFNPRDMITARCKIWKNVGEISEDVHCIARTRISVEKILFMWIIHETDISYPGFHKNRDVNSITDNTKLMSLQLSVGTNQKINFVITLEDKRIKRFMFQFSAIDASGNTAKGLSDEIWENANHQTKQYSLNLKKKMLTEKKHIYLPNNVLSLKCECAVTFGTLNEETETVYSNNITFKDDKWGNNCPIMENVFPVSKDVLNESLQSLFNQENESLKSALIGSLQPMVSNGFLSDIKLRTSNQTYPAHKFILIARSPEFKSLFDCEMQKIKECLEIRDLDDDTFSWILQYIYSSKVKQLDWSSAIKLYAGAAKFKILDLKVKCSSYFKTHLSNTNASEALELSHQHEDKDLKDHVQSYIIKNPRGVIKSEEWKNLKETNPKLTTETLELRFIPGKRPETMEEKQKKLPGNQKKRKLEEDLKNQNYPIDKYFPKAKDAQSNTVSDSCPSISQLPFILSKETSNPKKSEGVSIQDSSSTSSELVDSSEESMRGSTSDSVEEVTSEEVTSEEES